MINLQRSEVLYVTAHLILSVVVVLSYVYTVVIGRPDVTLQNLSLLVGGFWFGAMANSAMRSRKESTDTAKQDGDKTL